MNISIMGRVSTFLILGLCIWGCASVPPMKRDGETPTPPVYRLSKDIVPSDYTLTITVRDDAFVLKKFEGAVDIKLEIKAATKEIRLHASRMQIFHASLKKGTGAIPISSANDLAIDPVTETVTIKFDADLVVGADYTLSMSYLGTLGDDDMYGFYQSSYKGSDGKDQLLASTQFEATYARRAFPCFDEPSLKATYTVTIASPTDYPSVLTNTPQDGDSTDSNGLTVRKFKTTPKMSTYLLAFVISKFTSKESTDEGKTVKVWARPGTDENRGIALEQSPKLLTALGDYTGLPYSDDDKYTGPGKMDVVGIPDFAAGAMENWGLVTYREVAILDDKDKTANKNKQSITVTIAHEFVHQWFGNLVTLGWWSDAWLNEGFAQYFEYLIADSVNKDGDVSKMHLMDQFLTSVQQPIFLQDSVASALPLSSVEADVNTPTEASLKFGQITYYKGASVIRMMSYFLGDKFKTGIQKYLTENKNKNTSPKNLWDALDSTAPTLPDSKKMTDVMDSWVNKPGFPVVTATIKDKKVTLSQKRFLLDNGEDTSKWYIPVSYTKGKDASKWGTTPKNWIRPTADLVLDQDLLDNDDWIVINNQGSGYYRVNYDKELWSRITGVLTKNLGDIQNFNRAVLVDDVFNLARIGAISYSTAFDLAEYLSKETDYYAWTAAFNSFSFLLKRIGTESKLGTAIIAKILGLVTELYKSVPIGTLKPDDHIYTLNQVQAISWACKLEQKECVEAVKPLFNDYITNSKQPDSNLRSVVFCTGLRSSTKSTDDWNKLWAGYEASTSALEKTDFMAAMGCTRDEKLLTDYLTKTITENSGIRKQDAHSVFSAVYSSSPVGVNIAYQFLKDNHAKIAASYKGMGSLSRLLAGLADSFTTQEQVDDLKAFLETEGLDEEFGLAGKAALEAATANVRWLVNFEKDLNKIFKIGDGSAGTFKVGVTLLLTMVLAILNL